MKIKALFIASVLTILSLASCSKAEPVIVNNDSTIIQSVLINVNSEDWIYTNIKDNNYFYAEVDMPEISRDVLKTGLVKMYRVYNYNTVDESQAEMPCTVHYEEKLDNGDWNFFTVYLDYEFKAGKLFVYFTMNNFFYEDDEFFIPGGMQFRCVVLK